MKLEDFLRLLPAAEKLSIAVRTEDHLKHGLEEPNAYARFIAPKLKEYLPVQAGGTSVVLISAPGAVGKTTLAREIARRIGSPLWNLGNVNVGTEFLTGAIARAFGDAEFSRVKSELASGDRALVMDGLDEARLRAGGAEFRRVLGAPCGRLSNTWVAPVVGTPRSR